MRPSPARSRHAAPIGARILTARRRGATPPPAPARPLILHAGALMWRPSYRCRIRQAASSGTPARPRAGAWLALLHTLRAIRRLPPRAAPARNDSAAYMRREAVEISHLRRQYRPRIWPLISASRPRICSDIEASDPHFTARASVDGSACSAHGEKGERY